jgi:hypothetical protein
MAKTAGALQELNRALADTTQSQIRFMEVWFEGQTAAAAEFLTNIERASGELVGYRSRLEEAAQAAGNTLPEGINITTESLQRQIEIAKNSAVAILQVSK